MTPFKDYIAERSKMFAAGIGAARQLQKVSRCTLSWAIDQLDLTRRAAGGEIRDDPLRSVS